SLKTSIKTITYLSDTGCLEIQGASLDSSCYIPPLTTIKQDFRLLGQTSVDRLLQLSQGQAVKGNQLLPVSLVKRKTTLAPNTQTASPRALADSLMQLARQVSRLESGQ
ncbi:substrate-binding domain-containing protein, partial [Escherichia coli]|uniref:substrate-binding domain-containing protein n=1 Tax=Escherichia coli TaxID=562 RepID=UPI001FCEE98C